MRGGEVSNSPRFNGHNDGTDLDIKHHYYSRTHTSCTHDKRQGMICDVDASNNYAISPLCSRAGCRMWPDVGRNSFNCKSGRWLFNMPASQREFCKTTDYLNWISIVLYYKIWIKYQILYCILQQSSKSGWCARADIRWRHYKYCADGASASSKSERGWGIKIDTSPPFH